jgi:hypothetical protein
MACKGSGLVRQTIDDLKPQEGEHLVVKKAFGGFLEHSPGYDSSQYGLDYLYRFGNDYLHLIPLVKRADASNHSRTYTGNKANLDENHIHEEGSPFRACFGFGNPRTAFLGSPAAESGQPPAAMTP